MQHSFTSPDGFICVSYPDAIVPRPRVSPPRTLAKPVYTAQNFNDFFLSWLPTYPDRPAQLRPVHPGRIGVFGGAIFNPAIAPLDWEPHYPTDWPAPRLHRVYYRFSFDPLSGADMRVAQQLAWDPKQKAPLVRRARLRETTAFFYTIPAQTAVGTLLGCTSLADRDLTTPAIVAQALTSPALTFASLTAPAIIHEGVC